MRMRVSAALFLWAALDLAAFSGGALAELGGPSSLPPAGYQGLQFVDAKGCLFLRAGYGAQTVWVPMVDESKTQICGMAPSFGSSAAAASAAAVAPAPSPAVAPVAKPAPAAKPAPVAMTAPAVAAPAAPAAAGPSYQVAALGTTTASCTTGAPILERVLLRSGSTALVCTRGDGTLTGWNQPVFAGGAGVGAALGYAAATPESMRGARLAGTTAAAATAKAAPATQTATSGAIPPPPKGWKFAWKDDRLNPMRGIGTAAGQAQMDARWTREVPSNPVASPARQVVFALPSAAQAQAASAPVARVSTMSAPAAQHAASAAGPGALYVQIGSFAVPANAATAAASIAALGLPSASGQQTRGGAVLQVVFAGPFDDTTSAQSALAALRSAGFGDAFIR